MGEDCISAAAARLENYLERTRSALWVTADTVDHMLRDGASAAREAILSCIVSAPFQALPDQIVGRAFQAASFIRSRT